jgi:hypothetical protein
MKNRKTFWPATLWIAVTTLTIATAADRQPNVIVLFADDLGYGELSCQGQSGDPDAAY